MKQTLKTNQLTIISAIASFLIVIILAGCIFISKGVDQSVVTINIAQAKRTNKTVQYQLFIPSIKLRVPIYYGANKRNLAKGIGQTNDVKPWQKGNIVLAGHNWLYGHKAFTALKHVKLHDDVVLRKGQKEYTYKILKRKIVNINDGRKYLRASNKKHLLTMYTCLDNNNDQYRLLLQCELIYTTKDYQ